MNNLLFCAIGIPILVSPLCFVFKRLSKWIAALTSFFVLMSVAKVFFFGNALSLFAFQRIHTLSLGTFMAAAFFTLLVVIYSFKFMEGKERLGEYYGYIMITLGAAAGVIFAFDYLTLLVFWGILGFTLYMLVGIGGVEASGAAKKTLIIVGGADALMILGIGGIWMLTGSLQIGASKLPLEGILPVAAFLFMLCGAFAKAGVMPFHSWIQDCSTSAPATVMALLPASLDKLLGVYLLVRICMDIFEVIPNSSASIFLMGIGSFTIIAAVMGALIQHDMKKLLSFHAVSQVGYMVLGIGTGIPLGLAGGIFHMVNHATYKSCLFLCGGAVESSAGTTELDKLGGLAKFMPITFVAFLVAAFSISGIPPFNGFVSKWMIYQSLIEIGKTSPLWIIWLVAAMFGSAFTLASFMKLLHAVFLGQWSEVTPKVKEVSWGMWLPMVILAVLCLLFGVFAFTGPYKYFILPVLGGLSYDGNWHPGLAFFLLFCGLLIGLVIYLLGRKGKAVVRPAFIGGELMPEEEVKVSGVDFYDSVRRWVPLESIYKLGEKQYFDVYYVGGRFALLLSGLLSWLHNGLLHTYLAWMFLGFILLLFMLSR